MNVPPPQTVQGTHAVAGSASWSQVSAAQATAGLVPPAQCWPATHGAHVAGELGVAGAVCTVPGRHSPAPTPTQAPLEHTGASPAQCVLFKHATHIPVATSHCGVSPPQSPMPRHSTHSTVATLHRGVATPHGGQGPWSRDHSRVGPRAPVVRAHVLDAQVARGAHAHPLLAIEDRAVGAPQVRAAKGGERKQDQGGE
jgi:hypothetical protein